MKISTIKLHMTKKVFIITICILVLINAIIFILKPKNENIKFDNPVSVGSMIKNKWSKSDKEVLFIIIKPQCHNCALYRDSICKLHEKYKTNIQFIGICNPKAWDTNFLNAFNFEFLENTKDLIKTFHLVVTPQIVMLQNNEVTFSSDFKKDFKNEFNRLKIFMDEKYPK